MIYPFLLPAAIVLFLWRGYIHTRNEHIPSHGGSHETDEETDKKN